MKSFTKIKSLIVLINVSLLLFSSLLTAKKHQVILPGKPLANAVNVKPYTGEWKQLVLKEGSWLSSGIIREELTTLDGEHWQHIQSQRQQRDGKAQASVTRKLRKSDLFTLHMKQKLPGVVKGSPKSVTATYGDHKIQREIVTHDDQVKTQQVELPFDGFDGFIFGLALAGLPLEEGKLFRIPSVMASFMNGYWVDVNVSDGGVVVVKGKSRPVWFVDVSWLNIHDGDTYLPGPDASGGRYTIFKQQPKGLPAVYRYKTDTLDIILE